MNDLPAVQWFLRLLVNPGWAPLCVVVLHLGLAEFGLTQRFDHLLHFLGGASIAYFLFAFIKQQSHLFSGNPRWVLYPIAFASSCTVAVFWEFAEYASDRFWHTSIQQSVSETMLDLVFGVVGACTTLLLIAAVRGFDSADAKPAQQGSAGNAAGRRA
jgi:hypothetical protein